MPRIALAEGASVHCILDDFLWPSVDSTPVLMMHGFVRNARFWNRWVPEIAETHRVYRPDLLGCGLSDQSPNGYRYTPETIGTRVLAVLDGLSLSKVQWVGESSGGIIGLLLAAAHPDRIASLVLATRRRASRSTSSATMRWVTPPHRKQCAPPVSGHGEGRLSATGSTLPTPARRCLTGWWMRWTAHRPTSPPRSTIASAQQKALAETLPNGRVELFAGYGHGVNLLQPERCSRAALEFWRSNG
jgi:pimeloyl-ACP methyl ester carboxylesterase